MGVNANGIRSKFLSFKKVLTDLEPAIFFIEETKLKEKQRFKVENYEVFEKPRDEKDGGGLIIGCKPELSPFLVREASEPVEAFSIDIHVNQFKIRCCIAYGCQETAKEEEKSEFWKYLDEEVIEAKKYGAGLIIQCDGNLWAGNKLIPGDPRPQNRNGKLLESFLDRNPNMTVVNSLPICEGKITRSRVKSGKLEESILDFFIVCESVLPFVTKMVVDEENKHILTNYKAIKTKGKTVYSDHAVQYMDLALKVFLEKPKRVEVLNFKDKKAQTIFKYLTTETTEFSSCFDDDLSFDCQVENWWKIFDYHCKKAFKKIRIGKKEKQRHENKEIFEMMTKKNLLKSAGNEIEAKRLEETIADYEAKINRDLVVENFKNLSNDPENICLGNVWKSMRKTWPKVPNKIRQGKRNHRGEMVSSPAELKKLLLKEYENRLRTRPSKSDVAKIIQLKAKCFEIKLKLARNRPSPPWSMADLEQALDDLKLKKSRDPRGLVNELFKNEVIGDNLKLSLLHMFNKIRAGEKLPTFMNLADVTTVPKKGSSFELENERGIFRVTVLRSILMRLIYNDKYPEIDSNMSDCQMGGRKQKGCRNNIFIVNAIIHDVMSSAKKDSVCLQIYDYKQMFDAINLEQAANDIYDHGLDDINLDLVFQANQEVSMAIKTDSGLTERSVIQNVVLQGDTFGSLLASVQVDTIATAVEEKGLGYMYKGTENIGILALVDDIIGVTKTGYEAHQLNVILNVNSAVKQLQFGAKKCAYMILSKKKEKLPSNTLKVDSWSVEYKDTTDGSYKLIEKHAGLQNMDEVEEIKYLGFTLSNSGKNTANINAMKVKAIWLKRVLFNKLDSLNLGKYYFECAVIFFNVMLRSSILYASETYHNLSESEIRQLERIEESFLRQMLGTTRGCPLSQIYLETGVAPARYEIKKRRLLFLQYILKEKPSSRIHQVLKLQMKYPVKGDWVSSCIKVIKELELSVTFEDIRSMEKKSFKKMIDKSIKVKALEYLQNKRGKKGKEIRYEQLQMAEYLMPNRSKHSVKEKRKIFEIRNKMLPIAKNFHIEGQSTKCKCGKEEDTEHIYYCENWSKVKEKPNFCEIFEENVNIIGEILKHFEKSYENRNKINDEETPRDPCL